jgi:hypothetical protein
MHVTMINQCHQYGRVSDLIVILNASLLHSSLPPRFSSHALDVGFLLLLYYALNVPSVLEYPEA